VQLWQCPKCGERYETKLKITEAICIRKHLTDVGMELIEGEPVKPKHPPLPKTQPVASKRPKVTRVKSVEQLAKVLKGPKL
jgi:hypothetical protein